MSDIRATRGHVDDNKTTRDDLSHNRTTRDGMSDNGIARDEVGDNKSTRDVHVDYAMHVLEAAQAMTSQDGRLPNDLIAKLLR